MKRTSSAIEPQRPNLKGRTPKAEPRRPFPKCRNKDREDIRSCRTVCLRINFTAYIHSSIVSPTQVLLSTKLRNTSGQRKGASSFSCFTSTSWTHRRRKARSPWSGSFHKLTEFSRCSPSAQPKISYGIEIGRVRLKPPPSDSTGALARTLTEPTAVGLCCSILDIN